MTAQIAEAIKYYRADFPGLEYVKEVKSGKEATVHLLRDGGTLLALKVYRPHYSIDYAAPTGTPIKSVGDGTVEAVSYTGSNGNFVKIRHNSVYTTQYLHMSRFAKGITRGSKVKQGQVIGYVGSTGLATAPHCHYIFYVNGTPVDPLKVEIPPSHPVKEELRNDFEAQKKSIIEELEKIKLPGNDPENPPA